MMISVMRTTVRRRILGFTGRAPQALPIPGLLPPPARLPNLSRERLVPHLPLELELGLAPHLMDEALAPVPHFFGGVERVVDEPERLPQLTVFTLVNERPEKSLIRPLPNGRNRKPFLPHFAKPIPSCPLPLLLFLCQTRPKKKTAHPGKTEVKFK